jgi:phage-related protein
MAIQELSKEEVAVVAGGALDLSGLLNGILGIVMGLVNAVVGILGGVLQMVTAVVGGVVNVVGTLLTKLNTTISGL